MSTPFPLRSSLVALAVGVIGAAGVLVLPVGTALAWLSLLAMPTGVLLAPAGPTLFVAPVIWFVALFVTGTPTGWGLAVLSGLLLAGTALGGGGRPCARASGLLLFGTLLWILPSMGGAWGPSPWDPQVGALLLDLAPTTLVSEAAGLDWMRHSLVYGPAGADSMGPEVRLPYRGSLAGPLSLVLGCALALWSRRLPRDGAASPPSSSCPPASSSAPSPRT